MNQPITLVIHGGAGNIHPGMLTPEAEIAYNAGLKGALDAGYGVLHKGGSCVDAVCEAIKSMENNPIFNAAAVRFLPRKGFTKWTPALCGAKTVK